MPTVEFPPPIPFTFHVTPWLLEFCTFAVNCCVFDTRTDALAGEIEIVTAGGGGGGGGGGAGAVMVTLAPPIAELTALLVAWTVTTAGEGTAVGAV